jgi:hypothetical protein
MKTVSSRGRPKVENPLLPHERAKRYQQKRIDSGDRKVSIWMDPSTMELLELLRGQAGFNQRENSEFIAALLIKAAGLPWFGQDFVLPAQNVFKPIPPAPILRPPLKKS